MNYQEALQYIHAVSWRGSKPGLSRISELLSLLCDPHKKTPCLHVTGTNGKGSVCAMLDSVLRASGYNTGLYTSPYVRRFNERVMLNGTPIRISIIVCPRFADQANSRKNDGRADGI